MEFFPVACRCHYCRDELTSTEPQQPRKKRKKAEASGNTASAELAYVRQLLAVADARWARALPVLQSLLAPEALHSIIGDEWVESPLPVAQAMPIANANVRALGDRDDPVASVYAVIPST